MSKQKEDTSDKPKTQIDLGKEVNSDKPKRYRTTMQCSSGNEVVAELIHSAESYPPECWLRPPNDEDKNEVAEAARKPKPYVRRFRYSWLRPPTAVDWQEAIRAASFKCSSGNEVRAEAIHDTRYSEHAPPA